MVLLKADGLIADRQELQNGRTEVKDVGSEVCMFLFINGRAWFGSTIC